MSIDSIEIVDSHHHLWDLDKNYYPWLTDNVTKRVCGEYSAIRQNYLLQDFINDVGSLNVIKSVHVQAEHDFSDPVRETQWLSRIAQSSVACNARAYPNAIVAWADLAAENVEQVLARHCEYNNVRGIRQMCHAAYIDSNDGSKKDAPLTNPQWQKGLKRLRQYQLSFDLQYYYQQTDEAFFTVKNNPDIQFIIVHTGQPAERTKDALKSWKEGLLNMSQLPNCCLKISGLGMFDRAWTYESLRPIILDAIEIFTPQRCFFGSNFPVDGMMSSYRRLWATYYQVIEHFSDQEKSLMFSKNALATYRIDI